MSAAKKELYEMIDALPEEKTQLLKMFLEILLSINSNEDKDWLEANLDKLAFYDWGPEGLPKGQPITFKPGVGLIVGGESEC